ncbi:MRG/Alp3-like protein [Cryptosporidium canis]|uniref:MRG/Alp3-like protein n=1 Tax=Cryptosporidium canis TaxID=195482 RepID=A0A9D5DGC7_9CRYT|nr:MRG/Alp3-like protein [Cryptosporidium canis]
MSISEDLTQELRSYSLRDEARHKYRVGDLVYSLWRGQLWKAVILATSLKIHPNGWHPIYYVGYVTNHKAGNRGYYSNKSHNEWKSEALIFDIDVDTRKRSKETQKLLRSAQKGQDQAVLEDILARLNSQQERRISILSYNRVEDEWFDFSELIYAVLIHDKKQISLGKLVMLPKSPSVETIFEDYIRHLVSQEKRGRKVSPEVEVQEAILGMLTKLFNKALKTRLIYPSEVSQAGSLNKNASLSEVFGIEHLLRLLITLPKLLGDCIHFGEHSFNLDIDEESADPEYSVLKAIKSDLIGTVNSFIDYFNCNLGKFSIGKYASPSAS